MEFLDSFLTKNKELFLYEDNEDFIMNNNLHELYKNKISNEDLNFMFSEIKGGEKEKEKKKTFKIVPSFINVLKGKIIYNNSTRLSLEEIKPAKKIILLGTILDLNKIKNDLSIEKILEKDIVNYINKFDVIPLLFQFDQRNVIYKNKKEQFFNKDSKFIFIVFELLKESTFYREVPENKIYDTLTSIESIIKNKNYIVAHYIYENYYFLVNNIKNNLKIKNMYFINLNQENSEFTFQEIKNKDKDHLEYIENKRKVTLIEMNNILNMSLTYLTKFN